MTPSERASDERDLAKFDQLFASKPDAFDAVYIMARALTAELPLPPVVAGWLKPRLGAFLSGQAKTLDAALGLAPVRGQHWAYSRFHESMRRLSWNHPIYSLHVLASLGAAIDDAAVMVATKSGLSASTLARKYRDQNWRKDRKVFAEMFRTKHRESIEEILAQYPDDVQSRPVKARIRAKFLR